MRADWDHAGDHERLGETVLSISLERAPSPGQPIKVAKQLASHVGKQSALRRCGR